MAEKREIALQKHREWQGKIEVISRAPVNNKEELSVAYTPGVAEPCLEIEKNPNDAYRYTAKGNLVAVISNGTAVLGLGDIGAMAGKPVMEGKGLLFKMASANSLTTPSCLGSVPSIGISRSLNAGFCISAHFS